MRKIYLSGVLHERTLALLVLLLSVAALSAQTLKGVVTDSRTQEPIIDATVALKSGKTLVGGVVTDYDGKFALRINKLPAVVVVSFAGYNTEEIDVYEVSDEELAIPLGENFNSLNEVVVVGYGTQKRKALTGSVATVKNDALLQTSTSRACR